MRDLASVDIRIHDDTLGSAPLTLVKAAANARARHGQDQSEIDEVWCLFDIEWPQNHPNLKEAIALAKKSNVKVAVSNPCFELWLLLHFQDQAAWLDTNAAKRILRRHDNSQDKGLNGATYMPQRAEAADRARALDARHRGNATNFPADNPSCGMHHFLNAVEQPAPRLGLAGHNQPTPADTKKDPALESTGWVRTLYQGRRSCCKHLLVGAAARQNYVGKPRRMVSASRSWRLASRS